MKKISIVFSIFCLSLLGCTKANPNLSILDPGKSTKSSSPMYPVMTLVDPVTSIGANPNPKIQISGLTVGDTVDLYLANTCAASIQSTIATQASESFVLSSLGADGTYTFFFKINSGLCLTGASYVLDTTTSNLNFSSSSLYQRSQEGSSVDSFTLTLSSPKNYSFDVYFDTGFSTASNGVHYSLPSSVTFASGETTKIVNVSLPENVLADGEKLLQINLAATNSIGVRIGDKDTARLYIKDNDVTNSSSGSSLALGYEHACLVSAAGSLKCWGRNSVGQIGNGTTSSRYTSKYEVGPGFTKVVANRYLAIYSATCGLESNGTPNVKCWGSNNYGHLGNGTTTISFSPVSISGTDVYTHIEAGHSFFCGITSTGTTKCWGHGFNGKLGDGTTVQRNSPTQIFSSAGMGNLVKISLGRDHACGIDNSAKLWCWGSGITGQLGNGSNTNALVPTEIDPGTPYSEVSLGENHSCGITTSGVLKCWGQGVSYQLGTGSTSSVNTPTVVDSGTTYISLGMGIDTSCGITSNNQLKCWGLNGNDSLTGNGALGGAVNTPTAVFTNVQFQKVQLGYSTACAQTLTGEFLCWGNNEVSLLGNEKPSRSVTPSLISSEVQSIALSAAGASPTTMGGQFCRIMNNASLWCGGLNESGQIGDGTTEKRYHPQLIDLGTNYSKVSTAHNSHTCGITTAGLLKCWGKNTHGQLGDGSISTTSVPKAVNSMSLFDQIATGSDTNFAGFSCAIATTGALYCWGYNNYGQIGDGTTTYKSTPQNIDVGTNYSQVSVGYSHACGITTAGDLKCWGRNQNSQIYISGTQYTSPLTLEVGTVYSQVSVGGDSSCAVTNAGTLKCWGNNAYGVLGNGSTTGTVSLPTIVDSGTAYSKIKMAAEHACGVTSAGDLKCWGRNSLYQIGIGDGSTTSVSSPVLIDSGTTYASVVPGSTGSTCGITSSGLLKCWGNQGYAQSFGSFRYNIPWTRIWGFESP